MRKNTGIWLLVLLVLLGTGSLIYGFERNNLSPAEEINVVQVNENKPASERASGLKEEKAEEASQLTNDSEQQVTNPTSVDAGQNPTLPVSNELPVTAKISVSGTGIKNSQEFTLDELKQMNDLIVSATYFSRGAEKPGWNKASHNEFTGVLLYELLVNYVGLTAGASQVKIIAEDKYTQIFTIEDIKADYIDETDSSKRLRMIISWSQDGIDYDGDREAPFCLVMGQQYDGDYNRMKWVKQIASIVIE